MQLYPILLIGVLLVSDGGLKLATDRLSLSGPVVTAIACGPVLLVLSVAHFGVRGYERRCAGEAAPRAIWAAERLVRLARGLLLVNHAVAVLVFGWMETVRAVVGNGVLIDELITISPALAGLLGTWWVYYPIERRVREAVIMRKLDHGRAIFPIPTRGRYVLTQARLHLLFLLVPILLIIAAAEVIDHLFAGRTQTPFVLWAKEIGTFAAAAAVVMLAPLLCRVVLEVEPLGEGPLRADMMEICQAHGVKVRQLLLWKTDGLMINAAVMGLIGPLRYILMTDALLESMTRPQLQAVMAHEIGHVRRHHMPWMVAALAALIIVPITAVEAVFGLLSVGGGPSPATMPPWAGAVTMAGAVGLAFIGFGWVSRRFEQQADTFAACHMSSHARAADGGQPAAITPEAARTVSDALGTIAWLDAAKAGRRSWRHGSIAWRQAYLGSITGQSVGAVQIDRQIRWIKWLIVLLLGLALAYLVTAAVKQPVAGAQIVWGFSGNE